MTKKEFWLKLFNENDTALISAIILIERFVDEEQIKNGTEYVQSRKKELYEEMSLEDINDVFPNYNFEKEGV